MSGLDPLVEWLRHTEAIEIRPLGDEHVVWVTNGRTGESWTGTPLARCSSMLDAELVATALNSLKANAGCPSCGWVVGHADECERG